MQAYCNFPAIEPRFSPQMLAWVWVTVEIDDLAFPYSVDGAANAIMQLIPFMIA